MADHQPTTTLFSLPLSILRSHQKARFTKLDEAIIRTFMATDPQFLAFEALYNVTAYQLEKHLFDLTGLMESLGGGGLGAVLNDEQKPVLPLLETKLRAKMASLYKADSNKAAAGASGVVTTTQMVKGTGKSVGVPQMVMNNISNNFSKEGLAGVDKMDLGVLSNQLGLQLNGKPVPRPIAAAPASSANPAFAAAQGNNILNQLLGAGKFAGLDGQAMARQIELVAKGMRKQRTELLKRIERLGRVVDEERVREVSLEP